MNIKKVYALFLLASLSFNVFGNTSEFRFETGVVEQVGTTWITVPLARGPYKDAVVVPTIIMNKRVSPVVARLRNITSDSFDIRLVSATKSDFKGKLNVSYVAVDHGNYTKESHGINLKSMKINLSRPNHSRDWRGHVLDQGKMLSAAKYVRIELNYRYLHVAEVQVFDNNGVNVAQGKPSSQNSTGWGGVASRANDGNVDGKYWNLSVNHTNGGANPCWWEVDLGTPTVIKNIKVWNRRDDLEHRLNGFEVIALDANRNVVWRSGKNPVAHAENSFTLNDIYENPVVLGSILTANDEKFSHFWSSGLKRDKIGSKFFIGYSTAEDPDRIRAPETVGVILIKPGIYNVGEEVLTAFTTGMVVNGLVNRGGSVKLATTGSSNAVASINSMRGVNGGWAVMNGTDINSVLKGGKLSLGIDEDTKRDRERSHVHEHAGVLLYSKQLPEPIISTGPIGVFGTVGGEVTIASQDGSKIRYTLDGNDPMKDSTFYSSPITITKDTTIKAFASQHKFTDSNMATSDIYIMDGVRGSVKSGLLVSWLNRPHGNVLEKNSYNEVPDLSVTTPRHVSVYEKNFDLRMGTHTFVRVGGYLVIPADDTYTFYIDKHQSTAAKLYIDDLDNPLISRSVVFGSSGSASIQLKKGLHKILVEGTNSYWGGRIILRWSHTGQSKEYIPTKYFFHDTADLAEIQTALDNDGDGLSNIEELALGTNINLEDSDADGLSDYEEIKIYRTNANKTDSNNNGFTDFEEAKIFHSLNNNNILGRINEVKNINPTSFYASTGKWVKDVDSNEVYSRKFRGSLSYKINIESEDMNLLEIKGIQQGKQPTSFPFELACWVDGTYVGRSSIQNTITHKNSNFAMTFEGSINISTAGLYKFYTNSDDGSQLFVDGKLIVDNDGHHGMLERSGSVKLTKGQHKIKVTFMQGIGGKGLITSYEGPGVTKQNIPTSVLSELDWKYYEGYWPALPDFNYLPEKATGKCSNFDIDVRKSPISGIVRFMLPYLKEGTHDIKILWDNGHFNRNLRIQNIKLLTVTGKDLNGNGLKDWIDQKLNIGATVSEISSSKTSPVCLEGKSVFLDLMTNNTGSKFYKGTGNRWYNNIHLNPHSETSINIGFQNGVKYVNRSIKWEPTVIHTENSTLNIRLGDSLLLDPTPENVNVPGTIMVEGEVYNVEANSAHIHQFNTIGSHEVTASYLEKDGSENIVSLMIKVIGLNLPETTLVGLVGIDRKISLPDHQSIIYQPDPRLNAWYSVDNKYAFNIDTKENRSVVARIGKNGAILGTINLSGMQSYGASQTWFIRQKTLPDGTDLINMGNVTYPLQNDVEVHVKIFLPGLIFTNGSTSKILRLNDFNDSNQKGLTIFKTRASQKTAACHHIDIWQNGEFVGRAY